MTLTKSNIIESIYNQCDFSKSKSTQLVEAMLEIIKSSLQSGQSILISGFGKFEVKDKHKRRGRNPQTGDDLMLDARRVITFKWSGVLKDRVNGKVLPYR